MDFHKETLGDERRLVMNNVQQKTKESPHENFVPHKAARPMEVVKDEEGNLWLCDKGVAPKDGKKDNRCWRCGDNAFTRND